MLRLMRPARRTRSLALRMGAYRVRPGALPDRPGDSVVVVVVAGAAVVVPLLPPVPAVAERRSPGDSGRPRPVPWDAVGVAAGACAAGVPAEALAPGEEVAGVPGVVAAAPPDDPLRRWPLLRRVRDVRLVPLSVAAPARALRVIARATRVALPASPPSCVRVADSRAPATAPEGASARFGSPGSVNPGSASNPNDPSTSAISQAAASPNAPTPAACSSRRRRALGAAKTGRSVAGGALVGRASPISEEVTGIATWA